MYNNTSLKTYLKLKSENRYHRFIHSDNLYCYFTVSDFLNEFDGLWYNGFHILNSIHIDEKNNIISSKINYPTHIEINFKKNITLNCYLLKKNNGFLLEIINKSIIKNTYKKFNIYFKINRNFEISQKNIRNIITEYINPDREGFGQNRIKVCIAVPNQYIIENVEKEKDLLILTINLSENIDAKPQIFICYEENDYKLKKILDNNISRLEVLKKQHIKNSYMFLKYSNFYVENKLYNKALLWSFYSANSFVMHKNNEIGIWAGFPWFDNNWGRDTFISLPGISLVSGRYEEAWHIIDTFIKKQCLDKRSKNYGKIPNVIFNEENILYNTADGTPLLIREVYEYFLYTGDITSVLLILSSLIIAIDNVYLKNCDENYLYKHLDSDDWMDAKKDGKYSYSPRGEKAIEIQSLWYTALYSCANIIKQVIKYGNRRMPLPENMKIEELKEKEKEYRKIALLLKESINKYYILQEEPYFVDHIDKDNNYNKQIRPNILLAIYYSTLPLIPPLFEKEIIIKIIKFLIPQLVYKHGVATLNKEDENFHPVHITDSYHKDCAYHNGLIWLWLSGPFINVCSQCGLSDFAFEHTKNLSNQILSIGTPGTLSELVDVYYDKTINPGGTYSQAWSVAEFCRSFYQDYLGIRLNVFERKLYFYPSIPYELISFNTNIRYGLYETISIYSRISKKSCKISYIEFKAIQILKPITVILRIPIGFIEEKEKVKYKFNYIKVILKDVDDIIRINFKIISKNMIVMKDISAINNSEILSFEIETETFKEVFNKDIEYCKEITKKEFENFNSIKINNYLDNKIINTYSK